MNAVNLHYKDRAAVECALQHVIRAGLRQEAMT